MSASTAISTLEWRFTPKGASRYFDAVFLGLWLIFWAVLEVLVLVLAAYAVHALATGQPAFGSDTPLRLGPAMAVGAFVLVWLTVWTLFGYISLVQFLRIVWAEDRLLLDAARLTRVERLGPFSLTYRWPRADIRRVYFDANTRELMMQTGANSHLLSCIGPYEVREQAARALRQALGLAMDDAASRHAALPEGWEATPMPSGMVKLARFAARRRRRGLVVSGIALFVWLAEVLLLLEATHDSNWLGLSAPLLAIVLWTSWQAVWLLHGREEWLLAPGRLTYRRGFGARDTRRVEIDSLQLRRDKDSDGDVVYLLEALPKEASPQAPHNQSMRRRRVIEITQDFGDPTAPRCLGLWMAEHSGVTLADCQ